MTDAVQTALIAATSALAGGALAVAGQMLQHRAQAREQRLQFRLGKLEAIGNLVTQGLSWAYSLNRTTDPKTVVENDHCPPVMEAQILAGIYFPDLVPDLNNYSGALIGLSREKLVRLSQGSLMDPPTTESMEGVKTLIQSYYAVERGLGVESARLLALRPKQRRSR